MINTPAVRSAFLEGSNFSEKSSWTDFSIGGNSHRRIRHEMSNIAITRGVASSIQVEKVILIPCSRSAVRAIAFGGVPIGVAIPPIFAATGIDNAIHFLNASSGFSTMTIGTTIVIIIAVVAVLLINADSNAVESIIPRQTILGLDPNGLIRRRVRLLSIPYLTAAVASENPPKKSIMIGFANVL